MARAKAIDQQTEGLGYELFIAALSVLSIVNIVLANLFAKDENLQVVLDTINLVLTPIFLGDFIWRLLKSKPKSAYFLREFGWADLLSSLPFPNTKILRLFRLWRVARLFIRFGAGNLWRIFLSHRADNALLTVAFLMVCVVEFGSLAVLGAERSSPDANITSARDAIWWTYVTITTVGYGDRYPVTNTGRIVGMLVMTAGVGLFGTLAGFLSNLFLSPAAKTEEEAPAQSPTDARARVAEIRRALDAQQRAMADLVGELDEIEKALPTSTSSGAREP